MGRRPSDFSHQGMGDNMKLLAKKLSVCAVAIVLAAVLAPSAAKADYFTGHWHFTGRSATEVMDAVCVIAVNSHGAVAGSCTGPFGVARAEGVTNGFRILLRVHHLGTRPGGITGIAALSGVWYRNGVIRGTFVDSPFPRITGVFTGYPVR
jgi:hypothetical protein